MQVFLDRFFGKNDTVHEIFLGVHWYRMRNYETDGGNTPAVISYRLLKLLILRLIIVFWRKVKIGRWKGLFL